MADNNILKPRVSIFWFRRDLRLEDNIGLYHALRESGSVMGLFIFDKHILDDLPVNDARVTFIYKAVQRLSDQIGSVGGRLEVQFGTPEEVFNALLKVYDIQAVFTNKDYEPYAVKRDWAVRRILDTQNIPFNGYLDHLIFPKGKPVKSDGKPYTVFTPYAKAWKAALIQLLAGEGIDAIRLESEKHTEGWAHLPPGDLPTLDEMGFKEHHLVDVVPHYSPETINQYHQKRDFPAVEGTSRLGVHLRFGTISIRSVLRKAWDVNEVFVNELIWREFYAHIMAWFPHVITRPFNPAYEDIPWLNDEAMFECWKYGRTGYPLVDAGMRELLQTGYMHNRVRMVTASFLTKHLLIDWRWGEAWFAQHLLDYELASNNGGWQWAAGCGTDAAPYFRVFNPLRQAERFDPEGKYIRRWVPEWGSKDYPQPIVEHTFARDRCVQTFKLHLQNKKRG